MNHKTHYIYAIHWLMVGHILYYLLTDYDIDKEE